MKKAVCVLLFLMVLCFAATAVPEEAQKVSAGDIVIIGNYEQDNNPDNGPEPIEWIVLDYDETNHLVLLLSKYGLEAKPYNMEFAGDTWETCPLRTWLNSEFLNKAFTAEEQKAILITEVDNSADQGYSNWSTDGGNNTQDKIFLLSYAEANRHMGVTYEDDNNSQARVAPTDYASQNGAWTSDYDKTADGKPAGWWWLRSPGDNRDGAAIVYSDGSLYNNGVSHDRGVVRPALRLNLDSGI